MLSAIKTLDGHSDPIMHMLVYGDKLISGSTNGTIKCGI